LTKRYHGEPYTGRMSIIVTTRREKKKEARIQRSGGEKGKDTREKVSNWAVELPQSQD
jgi:hypothetical protein